MPKFQRLTKILGSSRWWAVFFTTTLIAALTITAIFAFRASIGALAWLSAEQIWIRNREQAVVCVRSAIQRQELAQFDRCRRAFEQLQHFDTLKGQVERHEWDAARHTMTRLQLQPNEIDAALGLFKISRDIPMIGSAYEVWGSAIQEVRELEELAADFRAQREDGILDAGQQQFYLRQVEQIENQLRRQEARFAELLGDAQKRAGIFGILSTVGAAVLLMGLGVFYWRQAKFRELERSAVARRLAVQERTFLVLVEGLREAVCAVNPETGRVQYANPAFWALLGYEPGSKLEVRDFIDMPPDELDAYLQRDRGDDSVPHIEQTWIHTDGHPLTMQVLQTRIEANPDEETLFFLARDVTEQRQMEARMMEIDRMAAVGTLAAGVGHEINNPLTFVAGGIDFAQMELNNIGEDSEIGERDQERLDNINDALEDASEGTVRVRDIVRDLKTFSRRDSGEHVEPTRVEPVLDKAIDMAMNEIRHRAVLRRDYQAKQPVLANESRLAQVFLNLLINGAQAIEEGAAEENEIAVATYVVDQMVVVEVSDTGEGITEDQREMVFEPFRTTKPVDKGTGLGLAISRNIVRSLGGSIDFESTPGERTTFRVRLPMADEERTEAAKGGAAPNIDSSLDILVIDDEARLRNSLRRVLKQRGAREVVCVESAQAGLDLLAQGRTFDAIFCDLLMPQKTGIDFFEALREHHRDVIDRVVFMTGGAFTERMRSFADSVDNPILTKPFDVGEIAEILETRQRAGQPPPA